MKKPTILLLFLAGSLMFSCKKSYTCNCVSTETDTDSNGSYRTLTYKNTNSAYSAKMKEAQAKAACSHEATAIKSNFDAQITGNGTHAYPQGIALSVACSLN